MAVIIPAVNEASTVAAAIQSAWRGGASEVFVVDGGSTDDTISIAERERAHVTDSAIGRARQMNSAALQTQCDILQFLHADCRLPESFSEHIRYARTQRAITGIYLQAIESPRLAFRLIESGNYWRTRLRNLAYGDQGIWVQRKWFLDHGMFAEVPILEDYLFSKSLPKAIRFHISRAPIRVSPRRWNRHGILKQTLLNQRIIHGYKQGVTLAELAKMYRRHDVGV